jgi:hypothetical protein
MSTNRILGMLKRFFMRFLIYFIVLLWPFIKLQNLNQSIEEYKGKLTENLKLLGLTSKYYFDLIDDPSLIFILYSFLEIIFGILGLFGVFIGGFFSIIMFIISNIIYFNPFIEMNKISLLETRVELFLNFGILVSLCVCTYYPYEIVENYEKEEQEIKEKQEKEKQDMNEQFKDSMPTKETKFKKEKKKKK